MAPDAPSCHAEAGAGSAEQGEDGRQGSRGPAAAVAAHLPPAGAAVSLGNAAVLLLMAVLAVAVLWHGHRRLPFWARVVLTLLGALAVFFTLLSGIGLL